MAMTEYELKARMDEVRRRLVAARKTRKATQLWVAAALGIHRESYLLIESGRQGFKLAHALKLANWLRVPLTWLLADPSHVVSEADREFDRTYGILFGNVRI